MASSVGDFAEDSNGSKIKILIIDNCPVTVEGLKQVLVVDSSLEISTGSFRAQNIIETIRKIEPQVLIIDVYQLDRQKGYNLIGEIKSASRAMKIIIYTFADEQFYFGECFRREIEGYILKSESIGSVLAAVHKIIEGERYVSGFLIKYLVPPANHGSTISDNIRQLTDQQIRVLALHAQGLCAKEIATKLEISSRTVVKHLVHIKTSLGLKNSAELITYAIERRIL